MWNWIKHLFIPKFEIPSQIVARELNETEIDLLKAQKEAEYWSSTVTMLQRRHDRLTVIMRSGSNR